ncbi:hypothetical protein PISMIDRAFT_19528 [Pisolithus microcarpus 441]|uniref:Secreted protein n=1 Tax=Pisolithus microcarpus 441 TaxID=765257 RepID=A0A0C9XGJ9_9AGAM|nr:hypothetical protein PISMIDRAFT_19528 [Pisolithus microcarpus 441]
MRATNRDAPNCHHRWGLLLVLLLDHAKLCGDVTYCNAQRLTRMRLVARPPRRPGLRQKPRQSRQGPRQRVALP